MKPDSYDPQYDAAVVKVGRRGPDKLLTTFSKTPFLIFLALSLCVHGGIAGFVSYGYIRDHYIDPEGAAARKAAALAAEQSAKKPAAPAPKPAGAPGEDGSKPAATAPGAATNTVDPLLAERKNTPVVKRITEPAKPSEIPKQPDDLGVPLDATNPK